MSHLETEDTLDKDRPITVEYVLELLNSHIKLHRERGVIKLETLLKGWKLTTDEAERDSNELGKQKIQSAILEGLTTVEDDLNESRPGSVIDDNTEYSTGSRPISRSNSICYEHSVGEQKHGYLMACYPLISFSNKKDNEFMLKVRDIAINLLTHPSVRVQLAAGGVLGFMSKYAGPSVHDASRQIVLDLVEENLNVVCAIPEEDELKSIEQGFDVNLPAVVIRQKVIKESMGWNHLEPSLKCLQFMIENLGSEFVPFMEPRLVTLSFKCLSHPVRYVRETGFQICTALMIAAPEDMKEVAHQLSQHLARGLSDNWNQVRMAAAISTRTLFLTYPTDKEEFYPVLLPKLCINRYYPAEGIRVYVQDSWKLIVGMEGRHLVAKYMQNIAECYSESTTSTNLAEREAACACISELASKIDHDIFLPHTTRLLEVLLECAKNDSWSVRDSASLACGNFVLHYPEQSKSYLEDLYQILFRNLEDPIRLLRQGAATALGNISEAYGMDALKVILPKLTSGLISSQSMQIEVLHDELTSPTSLTTDIFRNAKTEGREDACAQHEPQCQFAVPGKVLVSSESLLRAFAGCSSQSSVPSPCLSCRLSKIPQPWHLMDGCLYLVGSLATIPAFKNDLEQLLPLIIKTTEIRNYPEHWTILDTFCKILPLIAKAVGKKCFKDSLQSVLEPIFYTLESLNPVTSETGKECLRQLSVFIGPNILRSRIELYDSRLVNLIPE